jgi:hypothetical protein
MHAPGRYGVDPMSNKLRLEDPQREADAITYFRIVRMRERCASTPAEEGSRLSLTVSPGTAGPVSPNDAQ